MSAPRQFLVCSNAVHADFVDQWILCDLIDKGSIGNRWSGVYVRVNPDGSETYAVLWGPPVSLFGSIDPASPLYSPDLVVVTEVIDADGVSDWQDLPEPEPEPSQLP